jgi:hypothetical protein
MGRLDLCPGASPVQGTPGPTRPLSLGGSHAGGCSLFSAGEPGGVQDRLVSNAGNTVRHPHPGVDGQQNARNAFHAAGSQGNAAAAARPANLRLPCVDPLISVRMTIADDVDVSKFRDATNQCTDRCVRVLEGRLKKGDY